MIPELTYRSVITSRIFNRDHVGYTVMLLWVKIFISSSVCSYRTSGYTEYPK